MGNWGSSQLSCRVISGRVLLPSPIFICIWLQLLGACLSGLLIAFFSEFILPLISSFSESGLLFLTFILVVSRCTPTASVSILDPYPPHLLPLSVAPGAEVLLYSRFLFQALGSLWVCICVQEFPIKNIWPCFWFGCFESCTNFLKHE